MKRRDFIALLGGAIVMPFATRAQQKAMPVIGVLVGSSPGPSAPYAAALRQGLSETGYVEGENVAIEYRWAEGHYDRLRALAADLVSRKVDVIVAAGAPLAREAKNATSTIPIVFASGPDPVAAGLVASLARPGRNATGVSILNEELNPKRLELVSALAPQARVIALMVHPNNSQTVPGMRDTARGMGMRLEILTASTEAEIDADFDLLVRMQVGALIMNPDPLFFNRRDQLLALAARHAVPAIYPWPDFARSGGLIAYGTSLTGVYRQVGVYAGRVLKGDKPADLPVQQPTTFELVINLKTAKALGLTVPRSILARADEVIE
ncbi:MAG TPA: ABC transporter substrate-binding protein [Stellaceae bacterium]|nr:ABC transporter substrate-binding protein [Stellaceae bacterium]